MGRSTLFALLTLALAGQARADVITLRDGRTVEGAIVERGSTHLVVRHKLGEVAVERAQIVKVVEQDDPWDQLQRLRHELGNGTADERYRVAALARELGLDDEAKRAFLNVLRVDPDHPGARAALGHVRHEGRWLTAEDAARAKGLVQWKGDWVTPEERTRREEQARAEADARKKEREAAQVARAERREAEREADRKARRERIAAYERELAVARARAQAESAYYPANGILSTYGGYYGYPFGGPIRVVSSPWGSGWCRPPRSIVTYQPRGIYRTSGGIRRSGGFTGGTWTSRGYRNPGVQLGGSYNGGNWGLRFRFGF